MGAEQCSEAVAYKDVTIGDCVEGSLEMTTVCVSSPFMSCTTKAGITLYVTTYRTYMYMLWRMKRQVDTVVVWWAISSSDWTSFFLFSSYHVARIIILLWCCRILFLVIVRCAMLHIGPNIKVSSGGSSSSCFTSFLHLFFQRERRQQGTTVGNMWWHMRIW